MVFDPFLKDFIASENWVKRIFELMSKREDIEIFQIIKGFGYLHYLDIGDVLNHDS